MLRRSSILLSIMLCLSMCITGCNKQAENIEADNETAEVMITEDEKKTYKEIGDEAVSKLDGNATDDVKLNAQKEAIYNAIMENEGREIMKSINILDEEITLAETSRTMPKITQVIEMMTEDDEIEDKEDLKKELYFVYEGDELWTEEKVKEAIPSAIEINIREATEDDIREEIRRSLTAVELVEIINNKVEKVLG